MLSLLEGFWLSVELCEALQVFLSATYNAFCSDPRFKTACYLKHGIYQVQNYQYHLVLQ